MERLLSIYMALAFAKLQAQLAGDAEAMEFWELGKHRVFELYERELILNREGS